MKKVLLFLSVLISVSGFGQSKISGVVTYFFNKYQGDKPDIGASVYILADSKLADSVRVIRNYIDGKSSYGALEAGESLITSLSKLAEKYEGKKRYKAEYDDVLKQIGDAKTRVQESYNYASTMGCETKSKVDSLDKRSIMIIAQIQKSEDVIKRTVDASGNYSAEVPPGKYIVLITSKGRTSVSMTEILGKVYAEVVLVKENQVKDVSYNFTL